MCVVAAFKSGGRCNDGETVSSEDKILGVLFITENIITTSGATVELVFFKLNDTLFSYLVFNYLILAISAYDGTPHWFYQSLFFLQIQTHL